VKSPPHTVIYTHGGGRLGNQIMRFAHWMAWIQANPDQVEVLNLAFWPFGDFFEVWREHVGCVFPIRAGRADGLARAHRALPDWLRRVGENRSRFLRLAQSTGRWHPGWQAVSLDVVQGESIDLADPAFLALVARRPVTTCSGWKIASWPMLARQEAGLRDYFRPAPAFARRPEEFMGELRRRHDVVIGVLIRQSDYREWDDGRFYFSTPQYVTWIRQALDLHSGRRVAVVVASEDWQDPAQFAGLPVHLATGNPRAGGHWFENWVELSLCDLIISPPSTFSATAAFRGGVPLWPVGTADQNMALNQIIADGMVGAARHPFFSRSVK
jgi:hypothetical protein